MAPSPPLPAEALPAQDLREAVVIVLERDAHLFTAGERLVIDRLLGLPMAALSLYARLFGRQQRAFRLGELSYAEIVDLPAAAAILIEAELAIAAERLLPARHLVEAFTVEELRAVALRLGRPAKGRRDELVARLSDEPAAIALAEPMLWLCHRPLLRRITRLYLHDHEGDLSRLVVARLEHVRFPVYTPTGGGGLFPRRADLRAYEAGRVRLYTLSGEALLAEAPGLMGRLAGPPPEPWRFRFSGWRADEALALPCAQGLERAGRLDEAEALLRTLVEKGQRSAAEAAHRLALLLGKRGQPAEATALCATWQARSPTLSSAFARSGKRLARAAGAVWTPSPPLRSAPQRAFRLEPAPAYRARPRYRVGDRAYAVEAALVQTLAGLGRQALHVENEVWLTLFGLLFRDLLFAPVPGMLPTALLHGPLDLGTPAFYAARAAGIEARLGALADGQGPTLLEGVLRDHAGEAIYGVAWRLFGEDPGTPLRALVEALGGPSLAALLRPLAEDLRGARRGMPDLVVLPGPACCIAAATPSELGPGLLFAEVKGPGDQLRDEQRHSHHRLLQGGVAVELWTVEPTGAAPGLAERPPATEPA